MDKEKIYEKYKEMQREYGLEFQKSNYCKTETYYICDLIVELSEVMKEIEGKTNSYDSIIIYADTIIVPDEFSFLFQVKGMVFFTRELMLGKEAEFLFEENRLEDFAIYAMNVTGNAKIVGVYTEDGEEKIEEANLSQFDTYAKIYSCESGRMKQYNEEQLNDLNLLKREEAERLLMADFQLAELLSVSKEQEWKKLSLDLLDWVIIQRRNLPDGMEQMIQAETLKKAFLFEQGEMTFIPELDYKVYYGEVMQYIDILQDFETNYNRYVEQKEDMQERKKVLQVLCGHVQDVNKFQDYMLENTKKKYEEVSEAKRKALNNYSTIQSELEIQSIKFEMDVREWQRQQQIKLTFDLIQLVSNIVVDIGTLVATGGITSSAEVPKYITETKKFVEVIKSIISFVTDMNKLAKNIGSLVKHYEGGGKIPSISLPDVSGTDFVNQMAAWDIMNTEIHNIFEPMLEKGVTGVRDYLCVIEKVVIYGKAVLDAQQAYLEVGNEYVSMLAKRQIVIKDQQRIAEWSRHLDEKEAYSTAMLQSIWQMKTNMKIGIAIAIQNYMAAYKYWTLSDIEQVSCITMNATELKQLLMKVYRDYEHVLENLEYPPQHFNKVTYTIALAKESKDSNFTFVEEEGKVIFDMPMDCTLFSQKNRVRLDCIRVWLDGLETQGDETVCVACETSGLYQDRNRGKRYQFTSKPLKRIFEYVGSTNEIIVDGKIDEDFKSFFKQPTPFTQWKITILQPELIVSKGKINQIRVEFSGCAITE